MEFWFGRAPAMADADGVFKLKASTRTAKAPCLQDFINLGDADQARILAMARKHGPLFGDGADVATMQPETADNWRKFARLAGCILAEGRTLCSGGPGIADQDRELLSDWSGIDVAGSRNVRGRQFAVKNALDKWFKAGRLSVRTAWTGNSIQTYPTPGTLLGAIGLALADEIRGQGNRERCFECGAWFTVKRVLPGKRRFCKKCGRPAAMKHLMRERRAREGER